MTRDRPSTRCVGGRRSRPTARGYAPFLRPPPTRRRRRSPARPGDPAPRRRSFSVVCAWPTSGSPRSRSRRAGSSAASASNGRASPPHHQDGGADAVARAPLDRADGAPGCLELREDRAAHRGRIVQPRIVGVALERRRALGIVEQQIALRLLDALEPAAAQPAGQAHPLLHMLAAVPVIERRVVRRIDVDPDARRAAFRRRP